LKSNALSHGLRGLACVVTLGIGTTIAAESETAKSDPQAKRLVEEVAKAYQSLSAYADHGEFIQSMTINGKLEKQVVPMRLTLARPNKLAVDAELVTVKCDGKTLTTLVVPTKKYTEAPAPKAISFDTFQEGPLGSILFGGPNGTTNYVLFSFLVSSDPVQAILDLDAPLKSEPDGKDGDDATNSLLIDMPKGVDLRLTIDAKSKLLRAIDWVVDPKEVEVRLKGEAVTVERIGWSAGKVSTDPPAAEAFAFKAPKGYTKVESFERAADDIDEKYQVMTLVGKPAPDFKLTVLDGEGKTKTVSKADLAGKVVMIDFWTTWCPPCMRELPEIQGLITSYAKKAKDVVIVALSQDKEPRELSEVRKLVEDTLSEKKIVLTGTNVGMIALDPSQTVGEAFSVEGFPTVVLLDRKGIIQAAFVGLETPETFAEAIDTLLEGKPLAKPKAAANDAKKEK
jgi:thiol-disulfide isomerase/thioredoxin